MNNIKTDVSKLSSNEIVKENYNEISVSNNTDKVLAGRAYALKLLKYKYPKFDQFHEDWVIAIKNIISN